MAERVSAAAEPGARRPLVAANWKMHKGVAETTSFLDRFLPEVEGLGEIDVFICPPYTSLAAACELCTPAGVKVAAQNVHEEPEGAFTGEVSLPLLQEIGVDGVIVGHSERRALFAESDDALARKVPLALEAGMVPILCVGESEEERDGGRTEEVLRRQLEADLAELEPRWLADVVVAYEPIWAIGTGRTATSDQAQETIAFIRSLLAERDAEGAALVRILYGGSVKPANADELLAAPDVDGALVGGASLDADDFVSICRAAG